MENHLKENFGDVKAKNSSEEALKRWRRACWVVKNPKRRFRFTANVSIRSEADAIRRTFEVQGNFSVAGVSTWAECPGKQGLSDNIRSQQFVDLDAEEKEIAIPATRNGSRQILSLYDLLPGDILHLNIGDRVPAKGMFIVGCSLDINESSLTRESKPVHGGPSVLSGTKVQDWIMQDACDACPSDDLIRQLVRDLDSNSLDKQKEVAFKIRLLAKNKSENRVRIAQAGVVKPLIALILSSDLQAQEYAVTAILNLSLCDENKELMVAFGAIESLVRALRMGTSMAKENAACTLLHLSTTEKKPAIGRSVAIGQSGAIPLLVGLLESGGSQGKKDALTALYFVCSVKENKVRAVQAGAMRLLVELMADLGSSMLDIVALLVSMLVGAAEARAVLVHEEGIPVLVDMVDGGTPEQMEIAVEVLLQLCEDSVAYRTMVGQAGAMPPLMALVQSGTDRRKQKAETLMQLLRQSAGTSEGSA